MPNFRHRLTRPQQRVYDRSDAIASIPLRPSPRLLQAVGLLRGRLQTGDRAPVEHAAQIIADEIATILHVPRVRIRVGGTRPSDRRAELHGLYAPARDGSGAIQLWMITAKRGHVVAFKTFLRTLVHEIAHHLDYACLHLAESFHTEGFYKREASLVRQLIGTATAPGAPTER